MTVNRQTSHGGCRPAEAEPGAPRHCTCRTGGAWGMRHVHLEDGTVLAEDPSGAWYYDPVTGDVDIAFFVSPGWIRKRGRSLE